MVVSLFAALVLWRWASLARLFLLVAVAVLWVTSTPSFAAYLLLTLERQYPPVAVYRWRGWITAERNQDRIYGLFAYLDLDKKPASGRQPLPV